MNDETNNEPKSLAEMTKEELMFEISQTTQGFGASWSLESLRAELLRRIEAGEESLQELVRIDEALARRPALSDLNDRYSKVYRACVMAGRAESAEAACERMGKALTAAMDGEAAAEAEARRLREALEAYMFLEQTSGGLNPHRPGSNKYRAFELGKAALTPTPEAGKEKS